MMKPAVLMTWVACCALLTLSTFSAAQAQTVIFSNINDVVPGRCFDSATTVPDPNDPKIVEFSNINDAVPGRYFDSATTATDPNNPNTLIIGLNTGFSSQTWTSNAFTASTAMFHRRDAMDTISFLVEAPDGYYISKISYCQEGIGDTVRTGRAAGGASWVVDNAAADLGLFGENPTVFGTIDLTEQNKIMIPVSITVSLHTFSTPQLGAAAISLTSAKVQVELQPLPPPLPPPLPAP